jgi:phosphoribosyl 1,2-cyclic phosphodiesterase
MALYFASLNSGSNANCYYAGTRQDAILIDAGLSCRETEKRMKEAGLPMENLRAIFISHEHTDHINGLSGLAKKYRLPVYITDSTLNALPFPLDISLVKSFAHAKPVKMGNLSITPFRKSHDAGDPHSFMVSAYGVNLAVITDIGFACSRVTRYFSQCHAAFLESNYCDDLLANGDYPYHLKKRISGDSGHLSNAQALDLFLNYRSPQLRMLILSHLSKNNNRPELVDSIFRPHAGNTKIVVASRYEASEVYSIEPMPTAISVAYKKKKLPDERQLSLF